LGTFTYVEKTIVLRAHRSEVVADDWGTLIWYASGKQGNSRHMTLGICVIRPGKNNPRHSHPNCVEILRVARGRIRHTVEGGEVEMNEGDVITIPTGFPHQARNIGAEDAVLEIAFSSADRQVQGE
jgi:quercetin dioxygenase-like cupin family protein